MWRTIRSLAALCAMIVLCVLSSVAAEATTISLDVSPATPTTGMWSAGDLIEVVITASSDGAANQGFAGADFKSGDYALSVLDPTRLKIHDVLVAHPIQGGIQIDTESDAALWDGAYGYVKADDCWVYDGYADFLGDVVMSESSFEAVASAPIGADQSAGVASPVSFVHLVLEVQGGFSPGESSSVRFYGHVAAYNTEELETSSVIFGTPGGAINSGNFNVTIIPDPATGLVLLAGGAVAALRRRRPGTGRLGA